MGIECRSLALACCCFVLATVALVNAESKDLGRFGQVYPIVEPDLIEELQRKAHPVDLEKIRQEHAQFQPKNLVKLPKTKTEDSFLVDMTHTLDHDITDAQGRVLYKKGFTFNPMNHVNFNGGLIVIDGIDKKQVEWFKTTPYFGNKRAVLLISDGYATQLANDLNRPVYFLTSDIQSRLKLRSVPSVVVPKGNNLMVQEVHLEEK